MNSKFISKELKENRWVLLAMLLITGITGFTYPLNYRDLFAVLIGNQVNFEKFLWYDWFGKSQLQILLTGCIILGSTAIAREAARGTSGLLCSLPASRWGVLSSKLIAGIMSISALTVFSTLIPTIAAEATGIDIGMVNSYIIGTLADILLLLPVYLLSVLLSVIYLNSLKAGLTTAVFIAVFYAPSWFGSKISVIMWLTGSIGKLVPECLLAIAIFCTAMVYLSKKIYENKDL